MKGAGGATGEGEEDRTGPELIVAGVGVPVEVEEPAGLSRSDSGTFLAALDLGSNSFHMIVARVQDDHFQVVDRLRERIALAAGLDADRNLTPGALDRALACLTRFGQRIRGFPVGTVRAVGTNTLRRARNAGVLLGRAEEILGHPIEIISGREEARLIYRGVCHDLHTGDEPRLVIDIGGGSTEFIIGETSQPHLADSLYMGCVEYTQRFFPDGQITKVGFREAGLQANVELETLVRRYRAHGWKSCIGSSGTILALEQILRETGWETQGITRKGLRKIRRALVKAGRMEAISLPGLTPDRVRTLPGGCAILLASVEALRIERMNVSTNALREGLILDLMGRMRHEDVRDRTISRFMRRYEVDVDQARRVEATALRCLAQVAGVWGLDGAWAERVLRWAAALHEIGLSVSYSGQHKHGAYLLTHADMPGFSRQDQLLLATLVGNHRRKLAPERLEWTGKPGARRALLLCLILRLAVCLNRSRSPMAPPDLRLEPGERTITVGCPGTWLAEHPLSRRDLEEERRHLRAIGFDLQVT